MKTHSTNVETPKIFDKEPVSYIQWVPTEELSANDYNPNVVFDKEMKLLRHSILTNGWLYPIIVNKSRPKWIVIDGYHRFWLAKFDTKIRATYNAHIPCIVLEMSDEERMLMTVRLNRSKGVHVAAKMHKIVRRLIRKGIGKERIAKEIGATIEEINMLAEDNVFDQRNIREHTYSRAWRPKRKSTTRIEKIKKSMQQ
jgi:ParB-like chromosome segregation protein Spo0J